MMDCTKGPEDVELLYSSLSFVELNLSDVYSQQSSEKSPKVICSNLMNLPEWLSQLSESKHYDSSFSLS